MANLSKAVLITGCSTGIGRATAEHLAKRGWPVYATARKPEVIRDLSSSGCKVLALDVCDDASIRAAVDEVTRACGAVGVLINNAGYGQEGAFEEVPMDEVRRQLTAYWRDGSHSSMIFRWGDFRQHWTKVELQLLREMVDAAKPQWEILKAFPHWTWHTIACRYLQHFTEDKQFVPHYHGEKKYPYRFMWSDTEEYRIEQALSLNTSLTSPR